MEPRASSAERSQAELVDWDLGPQLWSPTAELRSARTGPFDFVQGRL
jgi:hypothetical protein